MEVQRKKGGKNVFNRTGILAVGLMILVVAVAGCTSQNSGDQLGGEEAAAELPTYHIRGTVLSIDKNPQLEITTMKEQSKSVAATVMVEIQDVNITGDPSMPLAGNATSKEEYSGFWTEPFQPGKNVTLVFTEKEPKIQVRDIIHADAGHISGIPGNKLYVKKFTVENERQN